MIDFHSHILPGIDDGAITVDDSIAMARSMSAFGYKTVCCTPHCIKGYYDLAPQRVREATLMLQADLDNADIDLELWPGMEYMLDECFSEYVEELLPLGNTKLVLCEAPQLAHPGFVQEGLELIIAKGFVPLIAHPERTEHFYEILTAQEEPPDVEARDAERGTRDEENFQKPQSFFKKFWPFASRVPRPPSRGFAACRVPRPASTVGCLFQANLGSFTTYYGESVQRRAYELLKLGTYTALASDLHDNSSASIILENNKLETNPLLKKLSGWDGVAPPVKPKAKTKLGGGQRELF